MRKTLNKSYITFTFKKVLLFKCSHKLRKILNKILILEK